MIYKILFFNEDQKSYWDEWIAKESGEFLQSWSWGNFQKELGRKVWRIGVFREDGVQPVLLALVVKQRLILNKNYLYSPRGPIIKDVSAFGFFLDEIKKLASLEKSFFLRIEPTGMVLKQEILRNLNLQKTKPVQPQKTLVLDLDKPEKELLKEMQYETRYAIKTAERRGVKIIKLRELSDKKRGFEKFWEIFQETNKRHRLKFYLKNYYLKILTFDDNLHSKLFLADLNAEIISGAVILFFKKRAIYLYSASLRGYGRYNAPTLLLWEAIKEAKVSGFKVFDFWGIAGNEKKNWAGVAAFKKSFGGKEIEYPGAWDLALNKRIYFLYKLAKKIL